MGDSKLFHPFRWRSGELDVATILEIRLSFPIEGLKFKSEIVKKNLFHISQHIMPKQ